MFGDEFYDLDGNKILRGQRLDANRSRRPAVINNERTVLGDLIPSTSWGSSLANLLTTQSWNGLRHPLIKHNHNVCELCGQASNVLDVHEIWSFQFPPEHEWVQRKENSVFGTQKLDGLMTVCSDCHRCFHLGKAQQDGLREPTLTRLAALNCWSQSMIDAYCDKIIERYKATNEIYWMLDLSWVKHPEGGVTVRKPWHVHEEVDCLITAPNKLTGNNITMLLGVPWKFEGEVHWRAARSEA